MYMRYEGTRYDYISPSTKKPSYIATSLELAPSPDSKQIWMCITQERDEGREWGPDCTELEINFTYEEAKKLLKGLQTFIKDLESNSC